MQHNSLLRAKSSEYKDFKPNIQTKFQRIQI